MQSNVNATLVTVTVSYVMSSRRFVFPGLTNSTSYSHESISVKKNPKCKRKLVGLLTMHLAMHLKNG